MGRQCNCKKVNQTVNLYESRLTDNKQQQQVSNKGIKNEGGVSIAMNITVNLKICITTTSPGRGADHEDGRLFKRQRVYMGRWIWMDV